MLLFSKEIIQVWIIYFQIIWLRSWYAWDNHTKFQTWGAHQIRHGSIGHFKEPSKNTSTLTMIQYLVKKLSFSRTLRVASRIKVDSLKLFLTEALKPFGLLSTRVLSPWNDSTMFCISWYSGISAKFSSLKTNILVKYSANSKIQHCELKRFCVAFMAK